MTYRIVSVLLYPIFVLCSGGAYAGDPSAGRDYYLNQCLGCHAFSCNRDGHEAYSPKLGGLFGRKAGGVEDFDGYTQELKNSMIIWSDDTLDNYFRDPAKVDPEGLMVNYGRIEDAATRRNVIAYLKTEDPSVDVFCSE